MKPPARPRMAARLRRLCAACVHLGSGATDNAAACTCASTGVHICGPCGIQLQDADMTYQRIWTWRCRYTTYLGGLGTGIGEGNEGVACALGSRCCASREVDVEFECSLMPSTGGDIETGDNTTWSKMQAGYLRQEIEGLGGVVKKKYRKRECLGAIVTEWEDERDGGEILSREKCGLKPAWCAWCRRIVPASGTAS